MEDKDYSALSEEEKAKRAKELWAELKALRASMMRSDWHAGFESILRLRFRRGELPCEKLPRPAGICGRSGRLRTGRPARLPHGRIRTPRRQCRGGGQESYRPEIK